VGQAALPAPGIRPRAVRRGLGLKERGVDSALLLLVPGLAAVVLLFFMPFLYGLLLSFQPGNGADALANYRTYFSDPFLRDTALTTFKIALPASCTNVFFAVMIAYRMRGHFRGKGLLTVILVIPVSLGTVFVADGLLTYLGPRGWLNRALMALHMTDQSIRFIHNYWGVFFALVISGFPFAFLLMLSYLSGIDPALERAAATLGAGSWQRFRRVTLPLLLPGIGIAFSLAFVLDFSVFPSAVLVGEPSHGTRVIAIAAYHAAFEQFDYSMASAIAMLMAAFQLGVIGLVLFWRSRLFRGAAGVGKG
jgi:putative spermidine/putrescine transport system permease protein